MAPKKSSPAPKSASPAPSSTPKEEVVVTPAPVESPADATPPAADVTPVEAVDAKLQLLQTRIADLAIIQKDLASIMKPLIKEVAKLAKSSTKKTRTRRNPSGFAKPAAISDELCEFLELPKGTEMPRTNVTRLINAYVKKNNLQDPEDKRRIKPDDKLRQVTRVTDTDVLTYFNMQRFIKHHFVKNA